MRRNEQDREAFKQNAIKYLRKILRHGRTVYTIRVYEFRNGNSVFAILIPYKGGIKNISSTVSDALDVDWHDKDGIAANSGFDLVMRLSYALHGYDSKGRVHPTNPHPKATPTKFKAGYTLEHQNL